MMDKTTIELFTKEHFRQLIVLMLSVVSFVSAYSYKFSYDFHNTPLSEALAKIGKDHTDITLLFIYSELDDYHTSARIRTDKAYDAVRQLIGLNPVSVIEKKGNIFVEAFQHGKFHFKGRIVGSDGEPVVAATIFLLSPKDSTVLTYGISNETGHFSIPCDKKNVIGKISCLGYKTVFERFSKFSVGSIIMPQQVIALGQLNVEADDAYLNMDKSVYVPNYRQKNAAQSGVMLLGLMAIPQIDVDLSSLSVKTMGGQNITIFIDCNEATRQDLEGMRTQDVKRVEFYTHPIDDRFKGAQYAINFVMQKYEYGGYTKLRAEKQACVNKTEASIYSKIAHKKMIFDIYADESYLTDRHSGIDKSEAFRFPDLYGEGPAEINRHSSTESSRFRNNINTIAFRALYSSTGIQVSNRVGLNISNTPVNDNYNAVTYDPEIIKNDISSQKLSSRNVTASYNGDLFYSFSPRSTFQTYITFNCGHNTSDSYYVSSDNFSITNNAMEKSYDLHINPRYSYQVNAHNRLMAYGSAVWMHNLIDYSGSSSSTQKYNVQAYFIGLHYDYISSKLQAGGEFGWVWEMNRISSNNSSEKFPQINVYANYMPANRHMLSLSWNYGKDVPDASQKSPNMLRQDELMWYTGTPDLKDYKYMNSTLNYTWLPNNRWQMSATGGFFNFDDRCVTIYTPTAPDGTMLRKYVNGGNYHVWMFNINATAKFFDGRLILSLIPQYWIYRTSGAYSYSIEDFIGRVQASYYLNNFYFVGSYSSRRKHPATQAEYRETIPEQYQLQVGWGNGAFNVNATAYNFLRKSWVSGVQTLRSEFYDYTRTIFSPAAHMRFSISATYTFGYGKKVERNNEVDKGEFSGSAILK